MSLKTKKLNDLELESVSGGFVEEILAPATIFLAGSTALSFIFTVVPGIAIAGTYKLGSYIVKKCKEK